MATGGVAERTPSPDPIERPRTNRGPGRHTDARAPRVAGGRGAREGPPPQVQAACRSELQEVPPGTWSPIPRGGASAGQIEEDPTCVETPMTGQYGGVLPGGRARKAPTCDQTKTATVPCTATIVQYNSEGVGVEQSNWMHTDRGRSVSIRKSLCGQHQNGEDRALQVRRVATVYRPCIYDVLAQGLSVAVAKPFSW